MTESVHPFYESNRSVMEASMRHRLDLAETILRECAHLSDIEGIKREVMAEFDLVLTQLPYVGGSENRMSNFFMRLIGFLAFGRVLRRHGVPLAMISDIARETLKSQGLAVPEAERLAAGRQFLSPENRALLSRQAVMSMTEGHRKAFPDDFAYEFVEPSLGDNFEFGINYTACGFCKFAARHGDKEILPSICGLDFDDYATRGIHLERTQTLAGDASHCNFRFSRLKPE
ncbi:L-2-amino-thiazoline-4-carboxylic acid hydrolase [Burkholderia sp. Ac-20365]|uniref:L-2-amino-thiazoline-4-carboxylic acid hydrolase n=1 Tax=Burkholderia sp. Ac-20365 TaxID=2703897 RepID=UPI00197C0F7A|nr:L-2-amino-thiazoline-4-carboxylic acid hydrolase [Burkholderia sp. Ac-20365]MBN3760841.1 L-2-amino-thiazoline-4-carboxylic acid hydrolase [Burkholderia sp. Ac-20365]